MYRQPWDSDGADDYPNGIVHCSKSPRRTFGASGKPSQPAIGGIHALSTRSYTHSQYPTRATGGVRRRVCTPGDDRKGNFVKRILAVVGVVMGLGVIGLTAAHASSSGPSTACTDGQGTEQSVPNPVVGVAVEVYPGYAGGDMAQVCWSSTPWGSSAPEAAGGQARVEHVPTGPSSARTSVTCAGDRTGATMVTIDCANYVYTFEDGNPGTEGKSLSGTFQAGASGPLGLARTGADLAYPATNATTSGAAPGGTVGTGTGTCTYVNGTQAVCPSGAEVAGVNVATGDASASPATNPGGCVTVGTNPCAATAPTGAGVAVATGDASNDTVSTTVLTTEVSQDLGGCYGYNMATC